jgi:hypothetical protein
MPMTAAEAIADIEPYQARVTAARALVFSGPNEKFYPSGALKPGTVVEVYREEQGGWLGIRPPQGSFSFVPAKHLSSPSNGVAEVRDDDVASLIGSDLSDKRNATQIKLKRGEVVEVIKKVQLDGESWVQIAPPAGEFRWIMATSVERLGAVGETVAEVDEDGSPIQPIAATETVAIQPDSSIATETAGSAETHQLPSEDGAQSSNNGETWRAPVTPVSGNSTATEPAEPMAPPPLAPITESTTPITPEQSPTNTPAASSAASTPPVTSAPTPTASTPAANTAPSATPEHRVAIANPPSAGGSDLQRQLTEIEVRLSRMASAPPQLWNTERLQQDTQQLLSRAQSQADRDAVMATMTKIEKFTSLARKYQQGMANTGAGAALSNPRNAAVAQLGVGPADAGRYDAVGILRPVVSKRPGAPQFALVDDRGQVVTFVTPTPDVNLQPYLGRRVGVAGNRGFIPEFNRAHVTAGRVTPLVR